MLAKKHIKRKEYPTIAEFAADVELVFSNALTFNQERTPIWEDARVLRVRLFSISWILSQFMLGLFPTTHVRHSISLCIARVFQARSYKDKDKAAGHAVVCCSPNVF